MTATLCAAMFSNSYVLRRKHCVMLRFVAVPNFTGYIATCEYNIYGMCIVLRFIQYSTVSAHRHTDYRGIQRIVLVTSLSLLTAIIVQTRQFFESMLSEQLFE